MSDYANFPPYKNLRKVLSSCPQAALFYISIWQAKKSNDRVIIDKKSLKTSYLTSKALARNYLLWLTKLELVVYEEGMQSLVIDILTDAS